MSIGGWLLLLLCVAGIVTAVVRVPALLKNMSLLQAHVDAVSGNELFRAPERFSASTNRLQATFARVPPLVERIKAAFATFPQCAITIRQAFSAATIRETPER